MLHNPALRMVGRRLAAALPGLAGVVIVTFLLTRALPGDPAAFFAGPAASQQAVDEVRARLGLDRSLAVQFLYYLRDLSRARPRQVADHGPAGGARPRRPAARLARADAHRPRARHRGGPAARGPRRHAAGVVDRSPVPDADHGRRLAADLLHRPLARLRLLLPPRLGAGAARAARRLCHRARRPERLLPDRQRAGRGSRDLLGELQAARAARRHARRSSPWPPSRG